MAEVDWEEYFDHYLLGIRRYLFKQSDDSLPRARIKWKRYGDLQIVVTQDQSGLCFTSTVHSFVAGYTICIR